jgi:glycosyltransferase involved in cell wall biosynthesis
MKIIFLSNYLNHHQKPLSDAIFELLGESYKFVETKPMTESRKKLGWNRISLPSYVVSFEVYKESKEKLLQEINEADVVIFGSAAHDLIKERIKLGKTVIKYAERPLKNGIEPLKYFPRLIKWHLQNPQSKPIYMLCASAYTAPDFAKFGMYKNKCFRWGYFPECKRYDDVDSLIASKKKNSLLWCGRLIDWKHPEMPIEVAKRLKNVGYSFTLDIVGAGDMEDEIKSMIEESGLSENVFLRGSMSPEKVRETMEQSEIYLLPLLMPRTFEMGPS